MTVRAGKWLAALLVAVACCLPACTARIADVHFSALSAQAVRNTVWVPPVREVGVGRGKRRCVECGSIVSTRIVEDGNLHAQRVGAGSSAEQAREAQIIVLVPTRHEISIRMSDGSIRVINSDRPAGWRTGERVILIAGALPQSRQVGPLWTK